ncbi:hypothetical protein AKJ51_02135 [candidate division MSBL1 archaeon SCGC-AAA382A20]|uniref:Uncharacterized protein n=1 Tax=candidate division MSBL1 archaeon SCGC-AAA382A20 TaxID=1698280 RepID=A0A133VKU1_9EURY|nr:hypothetical protein AKJ51_02135 [candidate division MSBL1 archaeon SCGC-AAA382A20]
MIFGQSKKSEEEQSNKDSRDEEDYQPKYEKPKIMMLDMPKACTKTLQKAGYNMTEGSFGLPYKVKRSDKPKYVSLDSRNLPNYEEQEIIFVNTALPDSVGKKPENIPESGVTELWQLSTKGLIDPRPYAMTLVQKASDRIQKHGGIFVVILSKRYQISYFLGNADKYRMLNIEEKYKINNWFFLNDLDLFRTKWIKGKEMVVSSKANGFGHLLRKGLRNGHYECSIAPRKNEGNWFPLIKNKYGECVGGIMSFDNDRGPILLLPQMPELDQILVELLEIWLAPWSPKLFPHLQGAQWVHSQEYEIPEVIHLKEEIKEIKEQKKRETENLKSQIEDVQGKNKEWYTLLNGTDRELVLAVIDAFHKLGFEEVIDVDKEENENREDIRIEDQDPVLVVEVKGLQHCPSDADCQQAQKHALMRMREWNKTEVKALTIINHERHLPPQDRDNNVFRPEIINNADDAQNGLMTTWDVWRILRNKEQLSWPDEAVKSVFYRSGRIEPIPTHYEHVGEIEHLWQKAISIVPNKKIQKGCKLAVEVGNTFEEFTAESIQKDGKDVDIVPAQSKCGIGYEGADEKFREGAPVYLVSNDIASNVIETQE